MKIYNFINFNQIKNLASWLNFFKVGFNKYPVGRREPFPGFRAKTAD